MWPHRWILRDIQFLSHGQRRQYHVHRTFCRRHRDHHRGIDKQSHNYCDSEYLCAAFDNFRGYSDLWEFRLYGCGKRFSETYHCYCRIGGIGCHRQCDWG